MNEQHRVVIAAAVAAALGSGAKIRHIRSISHTVTGRWARQGRASIQSSHNPGSDRGWARMPAREIKP